MYPRKDTSNGGGVPLENITGEIEEISDYLYFGFYDRVWFHENTVLGELGLGRWLVVSHSTSWAMSYWILKEMVTSYHKPLCKGLQIWNQRFWRTS